MRIFFILCFIFFIVSPGEGQVVKIDSLRTNFDKLYGLDVLLNNGKKYFPDYNPIKGHPFWRSKDPFIGDITISGKTFKDQQLKYNINKQEFILFYINFNNQEGQIILNPSVIDSVNIGVYHFVPNKFPDIDNKFIQQIHSGNYSCYVGWSKELQVNTAGSIAGYNFTNDYCIYYIVHKGIVHRFSNKSSFLKIFPANQRVMIRRYLASNYIKFKKIDDNSLRELVNFCEKI